MQLSGRPKTGVPTGLQPAPRTLKADSILKIRHILTLISLMIFLALACLLIFYPSIYSKGKSLNGEVIAIWKTAPPRPKWIVEVKEFGEIRRINYPFLNDLVTINIGDSLRKEKGAQEFFLKIQNTKKWISLGKQGILEN
jgi:hypothetical protein